MVAFFISPHLLFCFSHFSLLISTMNALLMYIVCVWVFSLEKHEVVTAALDPFF